MATVPSSIQLFKIVDGIAKGTWLTGILMSGMIRESITEKRSHARFAAKKVLLLKKK